jgi:hypothetical protein
MRPSAVGGNVASYQDSHKEIGSWMVYFAALRQKKSNKNELLFRSIGGIVNSSMAFLFDLCAVSIRRAVFLT